MKLVRPAEQPPARPRGVTTIPPVAQAAIWAWYRSNPDRVIVKVSFIKVRVRDLRILFEALAGPEQT